MRSSHVVLDQVDVTFDDEHAVAGAGLLLPATLAERLGLQYAADELVDLGDRPGAAHPGRKILTLVHSLLAGGDCIDDVEMLRAGATGSVLGHRVMAASTVGTFLRAFTFGHVRQLDRLAEVALTRAWAAGAGPADGPMTIDVDSTICEVHGHHKQGASYGYTRKLGYHPLLATRAGTGEVLHARQRTGKANTARGMPRFVDETIGRVRRAGATGELTLRADSGFWSAATIRRLRAHDTRFSITVRQTKPVRAAIDAIPETAWTTTSYTPDGVAQVADTPFRGDRLIIRRVRNLDDSSNCFPPGGITRSSPTGPARRSSWMPTTVATPSSNSPSATPRKAPGSTTTRQAASSPTPPGWSSPASPTTCCAGPPPLASASATNSSSPRPCAAPCSRCPAGSPTPPGDGRCTSRPAGHGHTRSPWRTMALARLR
jgi:DDE family transposase